MRRSGLAPLLFLFLLSAAAAPAAADWLQMRDGSRVETRGPWQLKGAVVAFTLPNGTLASLRAADVDLEASERITAEAVAPPKPAPTPAPTPVREAVLTITDADLAPATGVVAPTPSDSAPDAGSTTGASPPGAARHAANAAGAPDPSAGLEVVAWETSYDADTSTTTLTGTLRNTGKTLAYDVAVVASTFDPDGQPLTRSDAQLASPGVGAGRTVGFRIAYPGSMRIERAEFELSAKRASTGQPPPDPAPTPLPTPQPLAGAAGGVAGQGAQRLRVTRWEADSAADVLAIVGELTNQSAQTVYALSLTVSLQDAAAKQIASVRALVAAPSLGPGQSTTFRASFPGVREYESVRFQAREGSAQ